MSDAPDGAPRHYLDVDDLTADELSAVLDRAAAMKGAVAAGGPGATDDPLRRRTLAMLFEKPSTRTRVSFETGMTQLGGHAVFLGPNDTQLDRGEPVKDTARALAGYADAITARVFDHATCAELAAHASVPVINALTDDAHPCQTLADLLTIREVADTPATVAWVGDGNNVARSFAIGCALAGHDLRIATPEGYGVGEEVLERAADLGSAPTVVDDPADAVAGADVVYTDVWVSMGQEDERESKLAAFDGFQVDAALLDAGDDPHVMHCLPAHRGEEITDDVLESDRAVVWRQAENRLHAQKALLTFLIGG
jgi:ornithine carbamoyltransferase